MLDVFFSPVCFLCESLYFLPFVFQFLSLGSRCLWFPICIGFKVVMIRFEEVEEVAVSISRLGFWAEWGDVE